MRIVAVIPAYNEGKRIGSVVNSVKGYVDHVIVVDDGSQDETGSIARNHGAQVFSHRENCGAGAATMTGLEAARRLGFDTAVTIDADGQHNPADIPLMREALTRNDADLVIANRFGQKNAIPFIRRLFNAVGNMVTFAATGMYLADSQCGFKLFGPRALNEVDLKMSGFEFCTEIVREAVQNKWNVTSIPTKVVYSDYTLAKGQSFAGGVQTALKILLRSFLR